MYNKPYEEMSSKRYAAIVSNLRLDSATNF